MVTRDPHHDNEPRFFWTPPPEWEGLSSWERAVLAARFGLRIRWWRIEALRALIAEREASGRGDADAAVEDRKLLAELEAFAEARRLRADRERQRLLRRTR